jgi:glycosyltransferase involved in cell wall biosynthesis
MRVTFIVNHRNQSGGIRVVAIYAQRLAARGHKVTIVSRPRPVASLKQTVKSLIKGKGVPADPNTQRSHLDDLRGVEHRIIESRRPIVDRDVPDGDVVIATWWETAQWVMNLSPSKGAKAYFVQDFGANDAQPMDELAPTWRWPMQKIIISHYIMEMVKQHAGGDDLSYVANSVDLEQFASPPRGKQARPTIGMIYSRSLFKGADICLKAFDLARKHVPDLQLIGFGPHERSDELPLPAGAEFQTRVQDEQLKDIYSRCDAWLFGPRKEGFGLPILEAMACRTPVIATPAGAAPELVVRGGGILVNHDDPPAMARAILDIAAMSEANWKKMSDLAYATVTDYTWDDATGLFEAALHKAIDAQRAPARLAG